MIIKKEKKEKNSRVGNGLSPPPMTPCTFPEIMADHFFGLELPFNGQVCT